MTTQFRTRMTPEDQLGLEILTQTMAMLTGQIPTKHAVWQTMLRTTIETLQAYAERQAALAEAAKAAAAEPAGTQTQDTGVPT